MIFLCRYEHFMQIPSKGFHNLTLTLNPKRLKGWKRSLFCADLDISFNFSKKNSCNLIPTLMAWSVGKTTFLCRPGHFTEFLPKYFCNWTHTPHGVEIHRHDFSVQIWKFHSIHQENNVQPSWGED